MPLTWMPHFPFSSKSMVPGCMGGCPGDGGGGGDGGGLGGAAMGTGTRVSPPMTNSAPVVSSTALAVPASTTVVCTVGLGPRGTTACFPLSSESPV